MSDTKDFDSKKKDQRKKTKTITVSEAAGIKKGNGSGEPLDGAHNSIVVQHPSYKEDDFASLRAKMNSILDSLPEEQSRKLLKLVARDQDKKKGFSPSMSDGELAVSICERFPELSHIARHPDSNDLWRYNGTVWEQISDNDAIAMVSQILNNNTYGGVNYSKAKGVLSILSSLAGKRPLRKAGMVAFQNGVYDARSKEFHPHDPKFGIESITPCRYERNPKYPSRFVQFLEESCGGKEDRKMMMLAQYKYHLENRTFDQIYFENIGDGGCGLSTHQAVLSAMLGDEGVAATDLHSVDGKGADQHATSEFVGKTAWLIPDAKEVVGTCTNLKAITGEDEVRIREVFKKGYKTRLPMTVSYFGNQPIINTDRSGGLNRRRNVIKLDQVVTPEMKDPYLKDKLINELSGIVAYVQDNLPDEKYYEVLRDAKHGNDKMTVISETESLSGWIIASLDLTYNEADATSIGSIAEWKKDNFKRKLERAELKLFENYLLYCEITGIENPIKRGFEKALVDAINLKLSKEGKKVVKDKKRVNGKKHPTSCIKGIKIASDAEHLTIARERVDQVSAWADTND